jgi:hypothetical protein
MAGFEVSTYGRFWVSTEVTRARANALLRPEPRLLRVSPFSNELIRATRRGFKAVHRHRRSTTWPCGMSLAEVVGRKKP